ncbi:MAG: protein-glutamate O-methyltransferase CheR [Planctomycetes bacterium]|nr:protein-glutamate O-methyltransferase CheR [Planctomycetota bacterium]MBI3843004.1 protein-glutamate O-methyltransferase CheR [Planctomycetota bacterium]
MMLPNADFEYVRKLVRDRSAIVLDDGKTYLVESRLGPILQREGFASLTELVAALRSAPYHDLHRRVVEALTTNETSFFRDMPTFDALNLHVFPDLIQRRSVDRQINLWCAASSSGQEPYSIAMILRENFPILSTWVVRHIASDLNMDVLSKAKDGVFSQLEVNRGLPAPLLVKYFKKRGVDWQISDDIRRMIHFSHVNLAADWPQFPPMDVVFMRNVLIYFDVATKRSILGKIRRILRPGGYLVLGSAETTLNIDDKFERVAFPRVPFYRVKKT